MQRIKRMKRILSVLICLSLMFTCIPIGLAEEVNPLPQTPEAYAASDYAQNAAKMAVGVADELPHTAVVKANGTVEVWGDNTYGQLNVPAGLSGVKALAAGAGFTLALKEDGTIVGWGSVLDQNFNPSTYTIPTEVQGLKIKSIAAGGNMSAVVTESGEVFVWGSNSRDVEIVPAGLGNVVAMAINNNYAVALNDTGSITVWGRDTNEPAGLDGNVVAIAAGSMHWLALKKDGTVAIGGYSSHVTSNQDFVNSLSNVRAIAGGVKISVAVFADGTIQGVCMRGQISFEESTDIKAISGAPTNETICTLQTDGSLTGWSRDDANYNSSIPAGLNLFTMPSSNADLSDLSVTGTVYSDSYTLTPAFDPAVTAYTVDVPNDVTGVSITATTADSKATLKINGTSAASSVAQTVYGLNEGANPVAVEVTAEDGTVNNYGITVNRANDAGEVNPLPQTPEAYAASDYAQNAAKMAVGVADELPHTAVVKANGTVEVWGDNTYGQLNVPAGLSGVKALAAGAGFTLALKEDGTIVGWGSVLDQNFNPSTYTIPTEVQGLKIKSIAAGGNMSAVVTESGEVFVWGSNSRDVEIVPAGLGNVVAMAINNNYAVALNDTGSITVWGRDTNEPAGLDGNVVAIAAGSMHWLALKKDGTVAIGGYSSHVTSNQDFVNSLSNVRAIAGGVKISVAVFADGTIQGVCMRGQISFEESTDIKAISGAPTNETICTLQTDGSLTGWSRDDANYNSSIPAGLNLFTMPSSNADLSDLSVTGTVYSDSYTLTPAFDPAVTAYTVDVPNDVTGVSITATTADSKATLKINGTSAASSVAQTVYGLNEGANPVTVEVTAEDGTVKNYNITVNRAGSTSMSSNANLSDLTVTGYNLASAFNQSVTAYTVNVPNYVTNVSITATTADSTATLKINETIATSGTARTVDSLTVGDNQITVEVTAEDGTVKNYNITVNRAGSTSMSSNANLSDLTVTGYNLASAFNQSVTAYTVNVPNYVTNVSITATTADSTATLKINETIATSGTARTVDSLTVGDNQITVEVTAEDGTVKTYNITVNRAGGTPTAENEFNISSVRLLNPLNNEEIQTVAGQSGYRIEAMIDNNGQTITDGLVIVQVRNGTGATADSGGKVLNCVGVSSGIPATGSAVTTDYVLPNGLNGKVYVDVFVWDNWNNQIPLADSHHSTSFNVSQ